MQSEFGLPVGYSDHTQGIVASIAAVSLGAQVIEKHITIDRSFEGPDHKVSLDYQEFQALVASIRNVESALGGGIKTPVPPELEVRDIVRKSLVLRQDQEKGEILTEKMLTAKRPGTGIPAREMSKVIGMRLRKSLQEDELLQFSHLENVI